MIEQVISYIELALIVIGAMATIVKGLEVVAGVTPTTKDDEYVGKVKKALGVVSYWLDKLSLAVKK